MRHAIAAAAIAALILCTACLQRVEGTGRQQVVLFNDAQMNQLGAQAYQETLAKEKPSTDAEGKALLERVGRRLAAVAPDRGFKYEFTLIESAQVNAFCLPGGKVAVYTGILSYCQNEAGLAAVLGHEIAHAIANHGGERMSQGVLVQGAQTGLGELLKANGVKDTTLNMGMAAFGMAGQVGVLLPFSRKHESEADYLGLTYMAKAGYEPREAVGFWQRFATIGSSGPGFMSTHPPSADRAKDLEAKMPEAQRLYAAAADKHAAGAAVPVRYRAPAR